MSPALTATPRSCLAITVIIYALSLKSRTTSSLLVQQENVAHILNRSICCSTVRKDCTRSDSRRCSWDGPFHNLWNGNVPRGLNRQFSLVGAILMGLREPQITYPHLTCFTHKQ
ncbi:hypothetical protein Ae201684P_020303 [Aphanomyces euteiches]|uniref:Uncharacterized protein n=1 Tax=Aphanomyces euteiches TaxID=100861 RepID=A0A6G0WBL4_9STRA|nr:hypothetical protein Ae201684_016610 [Aphanomyces euteiches]KAH9084041.1 hypothetical protein Ae201684P_020303 [Aphanomyces euteiches]